MCRAGLPCVGGVVGGWWVENCIVLCNLRCRRLLEPKCYVFVFYVCVVLVLFVGMPSSLVVPVGPSSVLCSDASVW